jgi:N-acetylglucosamine-6-phosphate deacetylase
VKTRWTNVTVVSPTAEVASDLLIEGDRIAGIVPSATSIGDDWQAIDGQGAVLFPGMIDLLQRG